VRVHLCGVRGSTPASGHDFVRVGGQTSCIAIAHDDRAPSLILDAGTGLRTLAGLMDNAPFHGAMVLSHLHWDHMMGLPFFRSGDHPDADVHMRVPQQGASAYDLLSRAMSPPLFPIAPDQLRGRWCFETYEEETFEAGGFTVTAREIPHKGGRTMGLRVSDGEASLAYLPDHAPHELGWGEFGTGELHKAARELADGVDVLLHDAQYLPEEMAVRGGFGHAVADYLVDLGRECGVRSAYLFHHDPSRTDEQIDALHARLAGVARDTAPDMAVEIAVEGTTIHL
jgi:phosphoribosyl 1,2-cyclic phosphodiesterase